ncbi:MAG TPA: ABC transporter permease [Pyrinomonadaceae bacterium]|nr:ABC transporter permease [Pyrinomonadaceae bacterium]
MSLPEAEAIKAEAAGVKRRWWNRVITSEYWVLYLCLVYFVVMCVLAPQVASPENVSNVFSNMLPLLIVAVGQTIVLISGGIDLSATSIIALTSVVGASVMTGDGGLLAGSALAVPGGIVAMLLTGALVGLFNGAAITRLQMPPFIVTLTTMIFFSGFAIWLTQSSPIYNLPESFILIGKGAFLFVPYALVVALMVVALAHVALSRMLFGRWLYAAGATAKTALVSGVPVNRTVMTAYVASGVCAAAASILYTGRLETGSPVLGQRILLDVIGAAVIGGTSLFGGKGKVMWTVFGVLFITLIDNSLNMLEQPPSYFVIMMLKGTVILLAALLDTMRGRLLIGG